MKAEQVRNYITHDLVPGFLVAIHPDLHVRDGILLGEVTRVKGKRAWVKVTHTVRRNTQATEKGLVPAPTLTIVPLIDFEESPIPFTRRKDGTWLCGPSRANFWNHNSAIIHREHPFKPNLCDWYETDRL